jgi:hypothetical protein
MLLLRNQKPVLGIKALQNALKIAQQLDPKDLVPGSQGINYEKLALTLKHEIELYQNQRSYAHENFK